MLELPDGLTAETFLSRHWQKAPLFMPRALQRLRPALSRNELAWLSTLDDVESRIVFTDRTGARLRYRVENGPFDNAYLAALPRRDWTLLVHDVEKHLPTMRALFDHVPFAPDWRIDDLMVSFAAPGGGVGPHRDNYDVFLCQGIGLREWRVTDAPLRRDPAASTQLSLLEGFTGETHVCREGDVLYLPPGIPHWGIARRACMTYSIGMRAPQYSDLAHTLPENDQDNAFYADVDLSADEAAPGWISPQAIDRALALLGKDADAADDAAQSLGRFVTATKEWLTPEAVGEPESGAALRQLRRGTPLGIHGMARVAYDTDRVYVNGRSHALPPRLRRLVGQICQTRQLAEPPTDDRDAHELLTWMLESGAFEISGNS